MIFELTFPFCFFYLFFIFLDIPNNFISRNCSCVYHFLEILFLFCMYLCDCSTCTCVYVWIEKKEKKKYTHNHAPDISVWRCSCHRNEKQTSKFFFNYDANLTSVITVDSSLIFFSLRCRFMCMTPLDVMSSTLKTSVIFWGTSFKFWLRPWKKY